jgi:hypothetical protein
LKCHIPRFAHSVRGQGRGEVAIFHSQLAIIGDARRIHLPAADCPLGNEQVEHPQLATMDSQPLIRLIRTVTIERSISARTIVESGNSGISRIELAGGVVCSGFCELASVGSASTASRIREGKKAQTLENSPNQSLRPVR